jgi:hypothetical protein
LRASSSSIDIQTGASPLQATPSTLEGASVAAALKRIGRRAASARLATRLDGLARNRLSFLLSSRSLSLSHPSADALLVRVYYEDTNLEFADIR